MPRLPPQLYAVNPSSYATGNSRSWEGDEG